MNGTSPNRPNVSDADCQAIKDMIAGCGSAANRHDLAIISIEASLDIGVNTKRHLIGFLNYLGFDRGHVAELLKHETRSGRWQCVDGVYSTRPEPPAKAA